MAEKSRYAEAQPGNQSGSGQCMAVHQTKSLLTDGYVSYDDQYITNIQYY